jgi:hypothetical protein
MPYFYLGVCSSLLPLPHHLHRSVWPAEQDVKMVFWDLVMKLPWLHLEQLSSLCSEASRGKLLLCSQIHLMGRPAAWVQKLSPQEGNVGFCDSQDQTPQ